MDFISVSGFEVTYVIAGNFYSLPPIAVEKSHIGQLRQVSILYLFIIYCRFSVAQALMARLPWLL